MIKEKLLNKALLYSFPLVFSFIHTQKILAQNDSAKAFPFVTVSYGFQIPSGDLATRFGPNSNAGIGFYYKTKANWIVGLQWNFLFANNVREDSIFKNILTPEGTLIDSDGKNGAYKTMQRGHLFSLSLGKIFPINKNQNSGILANMSLVGMQHKIRIQNNTNNIPQINNEYKQGYDHLTNGLGAGVFLGYMYISPKNYTNIYGGFDATIGFTRNRRYNFNTASVNNNLRYDILSGIRIGIILPIYSKNADGKYFYY